MSRRNPRGRAVQTPTDGRQATMLLVASSVTPRPILAGSRRLRCRAYLGMSPVSPWALHRRSQVRTVRRANPKWRLAGLIPCSRANATIANGCFTRNRYCAGIEHSDIDASFNQNGAWILPQLWKTKNTFSTTVRVGLWPSKGYENRESGGARPGDSTARALWSAPQFGAILETGSSETAKSFRQNS
jgi:hypothetical protein